MAKTRAGDHPRVVAPMLAAPRCGAKTRWGPPCRAPAVAGRRRCRMHGGAKGSGAPLGNSNALKHGLHTREQMALDKELAALMRAARETLRAID